MVTVNFAIVVVVVLPAFLIEERRIAYKRTRVSFREDERSLIFGLARWADYSIHLAHVCTPANIFDTDKIFLTGYRV